MDKTKILLISDIVLHSTGVGGQASLLSRGLLNTGRYQIRNIGGAIKHPSYNPVVIEPEKYGQDFIAFPSDGMGNEGIVRSLMDSEKPQAIMIFTDPRFFIYLFQIHDEIYPRVPILYWHLWDNYPVPKYNKILYDSCDFIGCINEQSMVFVKESGSKTPFSYIPHAIPKELFCPLDESVNLENRLKIFGDKNHKKFSMMFIGRNARRKKVNDIMWGFSELKNKYGDVYLKLRCSPMDVEGANLYEIAGYLGLKEGEDIDFINDNIPTNDVKVLYNACDLVVNASNAEGFGVPLMESIMCGTRVMVTRTGGMQDQIIHEDLGDCMEVDAKILGGSQMVPYIYDDYVTHETIFKTMEKNYLNWKLLGRGVIREKTIAKIPMYLEKFNYEKVVSDWDSKIQETIVRHKEEIANKKIFIREF